MTLAEFKKWLWDASEKDGWLMSVNGQTQEGTKTLPEIDEFRNAHLDAEILLLHQTEKDTDNPRWMRLKARPDKVKTSHIKKLRKWLWRDGGDDRWWLLLEALKPCGVGAPSVWAEQQGSRVLSGPGDDVSRPLSRWVSSGSQRQIGRSF